jgi:hypothetical protein
MAKEIREFEESMNFRFLRALLYLNNKTGMDEMK